MRQVFPDAKFSRSLNDWAQDMNQLVESLVGSVTAPPAPTAGNAPTPNAANEFAPRMDIRETADHYSISLDLPGVRREDTEIELSDEQLTIHGTRSSVSHSEGERFHRVERTFGDFRRTVRLPKDVDIDRITAEFEDGVLNVCLPKTRAKQPRKIEIGGTAETGRANTAD
ncbi:MAG: Hsp20/alpha crystallin family protein [Planctomycetaceae bacterium]|jgi:HSP20 family protein|nr:MAG: Hsp20/alpha crystallin family protein [Planctomycetaceae bacterium]